MQFRKETSAADGVILGAICGDEGIPISIDPPLTTTLYSPRPFLYVLHFHTALAT